MLCRPGLKRLVGSLAFACVALGTSTAEADPIRLFAIGDSITQGQGSIETGGYRQGLDAALTGWNIPHTFQGRREDPNTGAKANNWQRHYGRGGISADDTGSFPDGDSRNEPYSQLRSLVDRMVDRNNITASGIRHPGLLYAGQQTQYDFRARLWGTNGDGTPVAAPTHTLLHIGTNTLTGNSSSVTNATTGASAQLNRLLRTFDLLDSTTVPGESGTFMRSDGKILLAQLIPKAESWGTIASTFEYNALIADKNSSVYSGLSADFKNRVVVVDMFKVRVDDVIDAILARRSDVTKATLLSYLQRDGDQWVDWILDYNEGTGVPSSQTLALNTFLWGSNGTDFLHPGQWGYEVMAQAWAGVIPEPASIALLLAAAGLTLPRRPRLA